MLLKLTVVFLERHLTPVALSKPEQKVSKAVTFQEQALVKLAVTGFKTLNFKLSWAGDSQLSIMGKPPSS
jgi:hypothetical protein